MLSTNIAFCDSEQELTGLRHLLSCLHGELRDLGLTPIEAVSTAAASLLDRQEGEHQGKNATPDGSSAFHTLEDVRGLAGAEGVNGNLFPLLYQEFLVPEARSGLGQYLTPLPVADLIAEVVASFAPPNAVVMDPFCGAGVLLHRFGIRREDSKLIGIDINATVATMAESLARLAELELDLMVMDSFGGWLEGTLPVVDAIITNPPFGQTASPLIGKGIEGLPPSLRRMNRVPAELLGLEVSVDALRCGGHLAAVLPQSILTNSTWADYRRHVFSNLRLMGVVSLPEESFAPFRGVAKACVLFAEKTEPKAGARMDCRQFARYYRSRSVGYDETGRVAKTESDMNTAALCMLSGTEEASVIEVSSLGDVRIRSAAQKPEESWVKLKDIADVFCGRTPPRSEYVDSGPFLMKVGNLRGSFISWADRERQRIPQAMFIRHSNKHLQIGDICLTAAAHRPRYIGRKVDIVCNLPSGGAMPSSEVMVIRLREDSPLQPEELLFYLRSSDGYQQMQDLVRGSTAHLYPSDVREMFVPTKDSEALREAVRHFKNASQLYSQSLAEEKLAIDSAAKCFERHNTDNRNR